MIFVAIQARHERPELKPPSATRGGQHRGSLDHRDQSRPSSPTLGRELSSLGPQNGWGRTYTAMGESR